MKKKSQMLPLNIIIIAIICLIVLIVVLAIFFGESKKIIKSTSCSAIGGVCLEGREDCPDDKPVKVYTSDCKEVEFDKKSKIYKANKNKKGPGQCCIPIS